MSKRMSILVLLALVGVVGLSAAGLSAQPRSKQRRGGAAVRGGGAPEVLPKLAIQGSATRPAVPAQAQFLAPSFHANPSPNAKGEVLKLHTQAAQLLTRANPIPARRLNHLGVTTAFGLRPMAQAVIFQ